VNGSPVENQQISLINQLSVYAGIYTLCSTLWPSNNFGVNLVIILFLSYYFLQHSARQQKALSETYWQVRATLEADMKLTEDLMYAQVSKYSAIFEAVADGLLISDQQGIVTEVNSTACRLLGKSPSQLVGIP
jgi:PAS domain-containing protein